jgi:hypothetical protein
MYTSLFRYNERLIYTIIHRLILILILIHILILRLILIIVSIILITRGGEGG